MTDMASSPEREDCKYFCEKCNKVFKLRTSFKVHMNKHEGKRYSCDQCDKTYTASYTLKIHKRSHSNEKPYKCNICDSRFSRKSHCQRHEKSHAARPKQKEQDLVIENDREAESRKAEQDGNGPEVSQKDQSLVAENDRDADSEKIEQDGSGPEDLQNNQDLVAEDDREAGSRKTQLDVNGPEICGICGKHFQAKSGLRVHMNKHEGKRYSCDQCDKTYTASYTLKIHKRSHSNEKPYKCNICDSRFSRKSHCQRHEKSHAARAKRKDESLVADNNREAVSRRTQQDGNGPEVCGVCEKHFQTKGGLRKHIRHIHDGVKYNCEQCTKSYSDRFSLVLHQRTHGGVFKFTCKVCGTGFTSRHVFRRHKKQHITSADDVPDNVTENAEEESKKPKPLVICKVCGQIFSSMSSFRVHKNKHLGKRYYCMRCAKSFTTTDQLKQHERDHENVWRFECSQCNAKFKRKSNLSRHILLHEGIKRYVCHICGKAFVLNESLSTHLKVHQIGPMFSCDICGANFKYENSVKLHKKIHANVKEFKCTICSREFLRKRTLEDHLKVHEKGTDRNSLFTTPVEFCSLCSKGFANSYGLKRHMRRHRTGKLKHYNKACGKQVPVSPYNTHRVETDKLYNKTASLHPKKVAVYEKIVDNGQLFEKIDPICFMEESVENGEQFEHKECNESNIDIEISDKALSENSGMQNHLKNCESPSSNDLPIPDKNGALYKELKLDMLVSEEVPSSKYETFDVVHYDDYSDKEDELNDVDEIEGDDNEESPDSESTELLNDEQSDEKIEANAVECVMKDNDGTDTEKSQKDNNEEKGLVCTFCDEVKQFKRKKNLISHLKKFHKGENLDRFQCTKCSKNFILKEDLEKHCKRYRNDSIHSKVATSLECTFCLTKYTSRASLKVHLHRYHKDEDGKIYRCDQCEKMFASRILFKNHVDSHMLGGLKSREKCKCEICGTQFLTRCSLRRHKRVFHIIEEDEELETEVEVETAAEGHSDIKAAALREKVDLSEKKFYSGEMGVTGKEENDYCMDDHLHLTASQKAVNGSEVDTHNEQTGGQLKYDMDVLYGENMKFNTSNIEFKSPSGQSISEKLENEKQDMHEGQEVKNQSGETIALYADSNNISNNADVCKNQILVEDENKSVNKTLETYNQVQSGGNEIHREISSVSFIEMNLDNSKKQVLDVGLETNSHLIPGVLKLNGFLENTDKKDTYISTDFEVDKNNSVEIKVSSNISRSRFRRKFCCKTCKKSFHMMSTLKQHMSAHEKRKSQAKPFSCEQCNRKFSKMTHLMIHTHKIHSKFVLQCNNCPRKFATVSSLKTHVYIKHKKNKSATEHTKETSDITAEMGNKGNEGALYKRCNICGKDIAKRSFKAHLLLHTGQRPYECSICSVNFSQLHHLKSHTQKCHVNTNTNESDGRPSKEGTKMNTTDDVDRKHLACSICLASFSSKSNLNRHCKLKHSDPHRTSALSLTVCDSEVSKICEKCGEVFQELKALQRHINSKKCERTFQCGSCTTQFRTESLLKAHLTKVHNMKPHLCDQCPKRFSSYSNLARHKSINHNNGSDGRKPTRNFMCSECGQCFTAKDSLRVHMFIHTGERPYQCSMCDASYVQSGHLHRHVKVVHEAKLDYQCQYDGCGKLFYDIFALRVHERSHTDERPYSCPHCPQRFRTSNARQAHRRTHSLTKEFECHICLQGLTTKHCLQKHLKRHEMTDKMNPYSVMYDPNFKANVRQKVVKKMEEKRYGCSFCFRKFTTTRGVYAHQRNYCDCAKNANYENVTRYFTVQETSY